MLSCNNWNNVASHTTSPQRSSVNLCHYKCLLRIKKLPVCNDELYQTEYIHTFTIITFAYTIKDVCSSVYMRLKSYNALTWTCDDFHRQRTFVLRILSLSLSFTHFCLILLLFTFLSFCSSSKWPDWRD